MMDTARAIQAAIVRADLAICSAERLILRAVIPGLIVAALLYAVIRWQYR